MENCRLSNSEPSRAASPFGCNGDNLQKKINDFSYLFMVAILWQPISAAGHTCPNVKKILSREAVSIRSC